jgi:hypothetical protein
VRDEADDQAHCDRGGRCTHVRWAACGGDDSDDSDTESAPACSDVYAPGRPTGDVLADHNSEAMAGGCTADDGTPSLFMATSFECTPASGQPRAVYDVSGQGWGFGGDVWQPEGSPESYVDCVLAGTDPQHP